MRFPVNIDVLDLAVSSYLPYQTYPTWQRENISGETYQLDSELKDWVGLYRSLALLCQCFVVFCFFLNDIVHPHASTSVKVVQGEHILVVFHFFVGVV